MKYFHFLVLILLVFSCSEQDTQQDLSSDLVDLSEKLNPTQSFDINPKNDTLIEGRQGTRVYFSANSLIFENGEQPTSRVTIKLKEVYSTSEMILNDLATTSNGELLQTSGMIRLEATSNSRKLNLKSDSPVKIQFNRIASAPYMRTYLGQVDSTGLNWELDSNNVFDTIQSNEQEDYTVTLDYGADTTMTGTITYTIVANDTVEFFRNWSEGDITAVDSVTIYEPPFYEIHSTQLNWINCDFFRYYDDYISVLTNRFDEDKTLNFLIFHDFSSIMRTWENNRNQSVFRNIPRGLEVTAIGIAKNNDDYYWGMREVVLNDENQTIGLDYKKSSLEEILMQLKALEKISGIMPRGSETLGMNN